MSITVNNPDATNLSRICVADAGNMRRYEIRCGAALLNSIATIYDDPSTGGQRIAFDILGVGGGSTTVCFSLEPGWMIKCWCYDVGSPEPTGIVIVAECIIRQDVTIAWKRS